MFADLIPDDPDDNLGDEEPAGHQDGNGGLHIEPDVAAEDVVGDGNIRPKRGRRLGSFLPDVHRARIQSGMLRKSLGVQKKEICRFLGMIRLIQGRCQLLPMVHMEVLPLEGGAKGQALLQKAEEYNHMLMHRPLVLPHSLAAPSMTDSSLHPDMRCMC